MALTDFKLEWLKSYDVLHNVRHGEKYIEIWERLVYCKKVCNGTKLEFYNQERDKRSRLSITAIKVICDDQYQYFLKTGHKELLKKLGENKK